MDGPKNLLGKTLVMAGWGPVSQMTPNTDTIRHTYWHTWYITTSDISIPHNLHISHLCHNTLCVNMQYLSAEPQCVNNTKQRCSCDGVCSKHFLGDVIYPDCMFKLKVCLSLFRFCNYLHYAHISVFFGELSPLHQEPSIWKHTNLVRQHVINHIKEYTV